MPSIAMQGGGARLADLLAAAAAVHKSGVRFDAYAGTSAGSVAAAVLAAGLNPTELRDHFISERTEISKLKPGSGRIAILKHAMNVAIRGRPLIDLEQVRGVFIKAFESIGLGSDIKIKDLPHRLYIVAANVRDNVPCVYSGRENLLDSLVRSCALPIIFTAAGTHDRHIVDGGVFNNLPVDILLERETQAQDIIAFAFRDRDRFDPRNALRYLMDIFSAMIDARVHDSTLRVGAENVCEIDTDLNSLSVDDFFRGLSEPAFGSREREVAKWLRGWVSRERAQYRDFRSVHRHAVHYSAYLCGKVKELEEVLEPPEPAFSKLVIDIKPSINQEDDGYDALISSAHLKPHSTRPRHSYTCYTIAPSSSLELISADWQVLDGDGNAVPHVAFPLLERHSPKTKVVLFFNRPLPAETEGGGTYIVRQRQIIKGLMRDLPEKPDWFELNVNQGECIDSVEIRLATRRGWGEFRQEGAGGTPGGSLKPRVDDDERNVIAWEARGLKGGERLHITYSRKS